MNIRAATHLSGQRPGEREAQTPHCLSQQFECKWEENPTVREAKQKVKKKKRRGGKTNNQGI